METARMPRIVLGCAGLLVATLSSGCATTGSNVFSSWWSTRSTESYAANPPANKTNSVSVPGSHVAQQNAARFVSLQQSPADANAGNAGDEGSSSIRIIGSNGYSPPAPITDSRVANEEVLLFFEASWCGCCYAMQPVVAQLKDEGFVVRAMDVDVDRRDAKRYGITRLPTFVILRDGREVRRASGVMSTERLRKLCRQAADAEG